MNFPEQAPPREPTMLEQMQAGQGQVAQLLEQIQRSLAGSLTAMAITEESAPPSINEDFPLPGMRRLVLPRTAVGGTLAATAAAWALLVGANPNRIGATAVNYGNADCLLSLSDAQKASGGGIGQIFLSARGGSWDFRLGPLLWCGSVSAQALATKSGEEEFEETSLALVEV